MATEHSEWQKMVAGKSFMAFDAQLRAQKTAIRQAVAAYNRAPSKGHLQQLFAQFKQVGEFCKIEPGVHIDLGREIRLGDGVYINANCVLLDGAALSIGDNVLIGPGAQLITVQHPMDSVARREGWMTAKPVTIERDVWIGAGAIILPGVTIGAESVIGAGVTVSSDIPPRTVVKGAMTTMEPLR